MPVAGPFYFAYVDETETTFSIGHHRMDEYIFDARIILAEGEKPKLELVIENPRVGLLSVLRKQWCWFAWDNGSAIEPRFFGRILGTPSDLQAETITVTFIAWPTNYKKQLQLVAEGLKIPPHYDPVFTDVARRDDPMAIFEAQSKLVCVDPVTNVVTAEDVLDASDGNVDFTEDDHFYNSMHSSPGAVPKTAIHVDVTVGWTQTARGYVDMGNKNFSSYAGDGLLSEWPKPLTQIAAGLSVFTSVAVDASGTANITPVTLTGSYQNREKEHSDGDTLSVNWSLTEPSVGIGAFGMMEKVLTSVSQTGVIDPFAVDENGDPAPLNIPASVHVTTAYVPSWLVATSLVLEYKAERPHTERIIFNLFADVQPTAFDPQVSEDSEILTISGSDVGLPIIELLNWTTVSGTFVDVGTVIFPDDPQLPGNGTAQVVTVAGILGTVEPDFSPVVGDATVDGTATLVSLGVSTPTDNAPDWTGISNVPTGTMILPRRPLFTTKAAFTSASRLLFPPQTTSISPGTILQLPDGSFEVCTVGGILDFTATMVALTALPDGKTYFIATQGGTTGAQYVIPQFNSTLHATTADNDVIWTAVGQGEIPIGGTPGDVRASSYFDKDRGRQSIEHLICRARARLRYASRCVSTQFQCSYLRGTELSLRKSATLHDYRLPGGLIVGKVTGVELTASGGAFACNATIQSAVGLATTIVEVEGNPTYVAGGYVEHSYQFYEESVVLLPTLSDVGYSPLVPVADEDGISFPLEKDMFVVAEQFIDSDQAEAVGAGLISMAEAAKIVAGQGPTQFANDLGGQVARQRTLALIQSNGVSEQLKRHPAWYELELKPINGNGAFNHVYHLTCTRLSLPKMIDLQEESMS